VDKLKTKDTVRINQSGFEAIKLSKIYTTIDFSLYLVRFTARERLCPSVVSIV